MYPRRTATKIAIASTLVTAMTYLLAGCGDSEPAAVAAPVPTDIAVRATDFHFHDLPDHVIVGSTVTLVNDAPTEMHELVALRLADDETRTAEEIMALPQEEMVAVFESSPPAMVILAGPGQDPVTAVGDGTFTEPGRYLIICAIPTGVSAEDYFAAVAQSDGEGPPQVDGGPPHFVHGMFAELEVVAS
jgi:hypothetical protein